MDTITRLGRLLFCLGLGGLGLQTLARGDFVVALQPLAAGFPGRTALVWFSGMALFLGSAGVILSCRARHAAMLLGTLLPLFVLLLHLPALLARPGSGTEWNGAFETVAMGGAAWVLCGMIVGLPSVRVPGARRIDRIAGIGRSAYALSLPAFGTLHVIYIDYVAAVIPAWIPWHVFWGYFTGAAAALAGLAILSRIRARLAATMLGLMYGSWVLMLHLPRVFHHPADHREWASLLVAVTLCGGAWLVAGSLADEGTPAPA
jgi:uncharacterized membrane protein